MQGILLNALYKNYDLCGKSLRVECHRVASQLLNYFCANTLNTISYNVSPKKTHSIFIRLFLNEKKSVAGVAAFLIFKI